MRKFGLTIGFVTLGLGVAFVLMRLSSGAGIVSGSLFGGPSFVGVAPAKEVPPDPPSASGVMLRRADNSLMVATNVAKWNRVKDDDTGVVRHEIAFDGMPLEKEIVITRDTLVYRDMTDFNDPVVDGKVRQRVKPGSLDDIRADALVQAWGEARGDRVIAQVVVYHYLPA